MFATLLESRRTVHWPIGNGALSLIAHATAVALTVGVHAVGTRAVAAAAVPSAPAERIAYARAEPARHEGRGPGGATAHRVRRIAAPVDVPLAIPPAPTIPEISTSELVALLDHDIVAFDVAALEARALGADEFERMGPEGEARRRRAALAALAAHSAGTPWHAAEVERMAVPYDDNPRPRYPFSLLSMGVEGNVVVQFVVDSTGAADMRSLRVLRSTHEMFTRAVRAVLPKLRFLPAEVAGAKVDVLVEQPFQFSVR